MRSVPLRPRNSLRSRCVALGSSTSKKPPIGKLGVTVTPRERAVLRVDFVLTCIADLPAIPAPTQRIVAGKLARPPDSLRTFGTENLTAASMAT